jgi:DNA-binding NtrC family response regulator
MGESSSTILVAEDDTRMRELVMNVLGHSSLDYTLVAAEHGAEALDYLENHSAAVVVADLKMPGINGLDLLKFVKERDRMMQVVMVTGYATVESAIDAIKSGAFDYIKKPFDNFELRNTVERAYEHYKLSKDNQRLSEEFRACNESNDLIGQSEAMQAVRKMIAASAGYDCTVLISGPSGSGKEVVARQIHAMSRRSKKSFVAINCAAIPENLVESELFGYTKGAFTGADKSKPGLFEIADGGTIFLDEINSAPLPLQAKLLRVTQEGVFYSMGDTNQKVVDVRIIAATNKDLSDQIRQGEFREDLFYRLAVMEIHIPPLSERKDDVTLLAYYFLNKFSRQMNKPIKGFKTEVLHALLRYDWPGSIREMENLVQRMLIMSESDYIDGDVLPPQLQTGERKANALDFMPPQSLEEVEAFFIRKTLRETNGDRTRSSDILGIDKSTLWRKMKRYNIEFDKS